MLYCATFSTIHWKRLRCPWALMLVMAAVLLAFTQTGQSQSILLKHLKTSVGNDLSPATASTTDTREGGGIGSTTDSETLPSPTAGQTVSESELFAHPENHEALDATLWVKAAQEYRSITTQTFVAAARQLPALIREQNATALVPSEFQGSPARGLPPAVIVDVDETVLDNSEYQKRLILSGDEYSNETWDRFVHERKSPAVPGAVEFSLLCRRLRVQLFFVTNRDQSLKLSTRKNLEAAGLVLPGGPDTLLCKNGRPEWTSDKASRRIAVGRKYRVLMLMGDDLNDFVTVKNMSIEQRDRAAAPFVTRWGSSWFMLPNPDYGSWEAAVIESQYGLSPEEKRAVKMRRLRSMRGEADHSKQK